MGSHYKFQNGVVRTSARKTHKKLLYFCRQKRPRLAAVGRSRLESAIWHQQQTQVGCLLCSLLCQWTSHSHDCHQTSNPQGQWLKQDWWKTFNISKLSA